MKENNEENKIDNLLNHIEDNLKCSLQPFEEKQLYLKILYVILQSYELNDPLLDKKIYALLQNIFRKKKKEMGDLMTAKDILFSLSSIYEQRGVEEKTKR